MSQSNEGKNPYYPFVCIAKCLDTKQYTLHLYVDNATLVYSFPLLRSPHDESMLAGGYLTKEKVHELINFLQDFVDGKI